MIRFLTAGESHGRCLIGILDGMPAGLEISEEEIAADLQRRQLGYGRGERMKIERDHARILSGVRYGKTLGSPIALEIENKDWPNWEARMRTEAVPEAERAAPLTSPRPGHADYAGALKYGHRDIRHVIERASARETAMRVALGAVCRTFFRVLRIEVASHVTALGGVQAAATPVTTAKEMNRLADNSPVRCLDSKAEPLMMRAIDDARSADDTVGGMFEVLVTGLPVGIGSCMQADRRLDGLLAQALMSIPAIKSVGFGVAEESANCRGSALHDRIYVGVKGGISRRTNTAGGIEGGMTNGESLLMHAAMKPLSTLGQPLETVDLATGKGTTAFRERSDVCAVPAAAVVGEAVCMLALMNPLLEKFGGDSLSEIQDRMNHRNSWPWD
jgi:chorismate synthase